jgi:hypothetical protein
MPEPEMHRLPFHLEFRVEDEAAWVCHLVSDQTPEPGEGAHEAIFLGAVNIEIVAQHPEAKHAFIEAMQAALRVVVRSLCGEDAVEHMGMEMQVAFPPPQGNA